MVSYFSSSHVFVNIFRVVKVTSLSFTVLIVFIHCFQTILHDKSFDLLEF